MLEPHEVQRELHLCSVKLQKLQYELPDKDCDYLDSKEWLEVTLREIEISISSEATSKITQAEISRLAMKSEQYKKALTDMQAKRRLAVNIKGQISGEKSYQDGLRSISALEKVKSNLL